MTTELVPITCPKCEGEGTVLHVTSTSSGRRTCVLCRGSRLVVRKVAQAFVRERGPVEVDDDEDAVDPAALTEKQSASLGPHTPQRAAAGGRK